MIFYVNQDFPCQTFNNSTFPNSLKFLPLEINLRNKKIFGIDCCKLPLLDDEYFLDQSSFHSTAYDNFLCVRCVVCPPEFSVLCVVRWVRLDA